MAPKVFERPVLAQRKHVTQEILGLDDVFNFLEDWPQDKRDLVYEVMVGACRNAERGQIPIEAVAENFRRFLKRHGIPSEVEDLRLHLRETDDPSFSGL